MLYDKEIIPPNSPNTDILILPDYTKNGVFPYNLTSGDKQSPCYWTLSSNHCFLYVLKWLHVLHCVSM